MGKDCNGGWWNSRNGSGIIKHSNSDRLRIKSAECVVNAEDGGVGVVVDGWGFD